MFGHYSDRRNPFRFMLRDETRDLRKYLIEISAMTNWRWIEQFASLAELPSYSREPVRANGFYIYYDEGCWETFETLSESTPVSRAIRFRNGFVKLSARNRSEQTLLAFRETVRKVTELAESRKISIVKVSTVALLSQLLIESVTIAPFQESRSRLPGRIIG